MEKNSVEYDNEIQELDKQISEQIKAREIIQMELLQLRKKKVELDIGLSKAKFNLELMKIQRTGLVSKFWSCKNSGL